MTLDELLDGSSCSSADVAAYMAGLTAAQRRDECLSLSAPRQSRLWDVASTRPPADGELARSGAEVFAGRNSLRLFSRFQKWFARQEGRVVGCNRHSLSPLIGPGYFTVRDDGPGRLALDYWTVPAQAPPGWPRIAANSSGMARPVYGDLFDRLAWISPDVLVGAAFRRDKPLDSYFILVRIGS
jgi:hypothetical protein